MEKPLFIKYLFISLVLLVACKKSPEQKTEIIEKEMDVVDIEDKKIGPLVFEMRTYYAAEGKLDELLARFRDHTTAIFEKHGMVNVGYWIPTDNVDNKLVYILGYESRDFRKNSWKAFSDDPDWKKARTESEKNGKLVDSVKRVFLRPTDYSPELTIAENGPRVFELRTYYTHEGKLDNLHARFRDHTMAIFENNGMSNIVYFSLDDDQEGKDNTLVYLISHLDENAAKDNWEGFKVDPDWTAAFKSSIADGKIVNNLTSVFMKATDFSPLK